VAPAPTSHPPEPAPEEPPPPPPAPAPEEPPPQPPEKPNPPSWTDWLKKFLVYGLACTTIGILTLLVFQSRLGEANSLLPVRQEAIVLLPLSTATASVTPMPIQSAAATSLPTNTATATSLPTNTATPTALPTDTATTTAFPTETATSTLAPTETASPTPSASATQQAMPATDSPTQPAPERTSGEKRIVVQISEQHLYAYQGDTLIHDFVISTGAEHATRTGSFSVLDKLPEAWSDPWSFWMPDWLGIYWVGNTENGIHALPVLPDGNILWGDALGTPASHGCVVLNPEDARSLYDWADIGIQVEILP
jgi:lipoprotein-anchoring transpeptidase ErfK/SrfK